MGPVFVILIHLTIIFIVSCIVAVLSAAITYFIANKHKKKRKTILAILLPFAGLYAFYVTGLIGVIVVSQFYRVDLGIGDAWYVPINDSCELVMIDVPEQASLEYNRKTLLEDISHLQMTDNRVFGKTFSKDFFVLHLETQVLKTYKTEEELMLDEKIVLKLQETLAFYNDRKWEVAGGAMIFVLILASSVAFFLVYILRRFVLHETKRK